METLREFRRRRGWSQKDLAEESGVGQDTISGIESGRHEPRPSTLRKLADALDVEVADFFREPAVPLTEAPREAGLATADPSAPSAKLVAASALEEIARLWSEQLAHGFYDPRTLGNMHAAGYVLAQYHESAVKDHRGTLRPNFRAQLEAAEERFADVVAQIIETREALEQADRGRPTPPDELATKREAREAEREKLLRRLRGSSPAKHA